MHFLRALTLLVSLSAIAMEPCATLVEAQSLMLFDISPRRAHLTRRNADALPLLTEFRTHLRHTRHLKFAETSGALILNHSSTPDLLESERSYAIERVSMAISALNENGRLRSGAIAAEPPLSEMVPLLAHLSGSKRVPADVWSSLYLEQHLNPGCVGFFAGVMAWLPTMAYFKLPFGEGICALGGFVAGAMLTGILGRHLFYYFAGEHSARDRRCEQNAKDCAGLDPALRDTFGHWQKILETPLSATERDLTPQEFHFVDVPGTRGHHFSMLFRRHASGDRLAYYLWNEEHLGVAERPAAGVTPTRLAERTHHRAAVTARFHALVAQSVRELLPTEIGPLPEVANQFTSRTTTSDAQIERAIEFLETGSPSPQAIVEFLNSLSS